MRLLPRFFPPIYSQDSRSVVVVSVVAESQSLSADFGQLTDFTDRIENHGHRQFLTSD